MSLAFDKSVRRFDVDGRLHIELTNISKANICPYYGEEIINGAMNGSELQLDPTRIYKLYRSPTALQEGAKTFNNIPLMRLHTPQSADDPKKEDIVGSTGTDAEFDGTYLKNSLVVWDATAIADIEAEKKRQLSCAYRYKAQMTPGSFLGESYDGVMTDIIGNHVAIVEEGRAGPDVMVGDAMPIFTKPEVRIFNEEFDMPKANTATSGMPLIVRGALAGYLKPKLAADQAMPDLKAVVLGTTGKNWKTAKGVIVTRLREALKGAKLAGDAKMEDVHDFLDSLDKEAEDADVPPGMSADPDPEDTNRAIDEEADPEEMKRKKMEADKRAKDRKARDKAARDAGIDPEEMEAEDDVDGETPEEKAKRLREAKDKKARDEKEMKEKEAKDKKAMDAAISNSVALAIKAERERAEAVREAEHLVMPYIGKIPLAQDTAAAVYKLALDHLKVDVKGRHPDAYKDILLAQPKPGTNPLGYHFARDSSPTDLASRFPDFNRLRKSA